ncbi:hypothetical protein ACWF95_10895 [Streptomyces vinaceus]
MVIHTMLRTVAVPAAPAQARWVMGDFGGRRKSARTGRPVWETLSG